MITVKSENGKIGDHEKFMYVVFTILPIRSFSFAPFYCKRRIRGSYIAN